MAKSGSRCATSTTDLPGHGAFLTRPFQRVISACRNWPNSSGVLGLATRPMSSKRFLRSAPVSAFYTSSFSFMTTGRDGAALVRDLGHFAQLRLLCQQQGGTLLRAARTGGAVAHLARAIADEPEQVGHRAEQKRRLAGKGYGPAVRQQRANTIRLNLRRDRRVFSPGC